VSKRLGSPYRSGRTDHWVKIKNPAAPAMKREAEEVGLYLSCQTYLFAYFGGFQFQLRHRENRLKTSMERKTALVVGGQEPTVNALS
jgi:ATP-dependent DNA ligase